MMELPSSGKKGKPKRRFLDAVKVDIEVWKWRRQDKMETNDPPWGPLRRKVESRTI